MNVWRICASISVTITYIWIRFGTELKYHTINMPEWSNSHNLKLQNGGRRHLGFFRLCEKKNVNSGLDKDICIKFYGIMHWTLAYTTACLWCMASVISDIPSQPNLVLKVPTHRGMARLCWPGWLVTYRGSLPTRRRGIWTFHSSALSFPGAKSPQMELQMEL